VTSKMRHVPIERRTILSEHGWISLPTDSFYFMSCAIQRYVTTITTRKSPTELLYGSPVRLLPKLSVSKSEAVPAVADFIDVFRDL